MDDGDWCSSAAHLSQRFHSASTSSASLRIESRLVDILSCQNPAALARIVLFTLRHADALDIVAVECGNQETARILSHLCQNLCLSASQKTAPVTTPSAPAAKTPIVSIQSWSQRLKNGANEDAQWDAAAATNGTGGGKTLDLVRRLERQTSWNLIQRTDPSGVTHLQVSTPPPSSLASSVPLSAAPAKNLPSVAEGERRGSDSLKSSQRSNGAETPADHTRIGAQRRSSGAESRADSCIVSLQTPELPLPPSPSASDSSASGSTSAAQRKPAPSPKKKEKAVKSQSSPPPTTSTGKCASLKHSASKAAESAAANTGAAEGRKKKAPSLMNRWLNDELEAVLQSQLAGRGRECERDRKADRDHKFERDRKADRDQQNERDRKSECQWDRYDNSLKSSTSTLGRGRKGPSPTPAPPSAAPTPSTKIKRDKSKTRSFLFKLTSSGDKTSAPADASDDTAASTLSVGGGIKERGRSLIRRSAAAAALMVRAPSQPPPSSSAASSAASTYLIPTKSGHELSRTVYPKDLATGGGVNYNSQQSAPPIFLAGHAPFPLRLAFNNSGAGGPRSFHAVHLTSPPTVPPPPPPSSSASAASQWFWNEVAAAADANNNNNHHHHAANVNGGVGHQQLIYYQPLNAPEFKRIRSRSQSPGRR